MLRADTSEGFNVHEPQRDVQLPGRHAERQRAEGAHFPAGQCARSCAFPVGGPVLVDELAHVAARPDPRV